MPIDDIQRTIIETCLIRIEERRGNAFTADQRDRVLEVAEMKLGNMILPGLPEMSADEQEKRVEGMVRLALIARGETIPVPDEITADFLMQTSDSELSALLYDYVCTSFSNNGVYKIGSDERQAVLRLPRGLRIVYTLSALHGEVYNGGFQQFFTNSSGKIAQEALEDCRLVGAQKHAETLQRAIDLWKSASDLWDAAKGEKGAEERALRTIQAEIEPALNALDSPYYRLEEIESLWDLATAYLRQHPDECLPKCGVDSEAT